MGVLSTPCALAAKLGTSSQLQKVEYAYVFGAFSVRWPVSPFYVKPSAEDNIQVISDEDSSAR